MIAAGIFTIYIGYRLFHMGISTTETGKNQGSGRIIGNFAGMNLSIINTAPGTAFALFGVIIIGLQVVQGGPEAIINFYETGNPAKASLRGEAIEKVIQTESAVISFRESSHKAVELLQDKKPIAAEQRVVNLLLSIQPEINNLAWVLSQTKPKTTYARSLADLALSLKPHDPETLHTAAIIAHANGERDRAFSLLKKANKSDNTKNNKYLKLLEKWTQSELLHLKQ